MMTNHRVIIEDGQVSVVCPGCARPFTVEVVQNQSVGASCAKYWTKLPAKNNKICKVLLFSDGLDELKAGMSKQNIIKKYSNEVPEIRNPARISELIGAGIFTVDKSQNPPICYFKPEVAGQWVANTYNNSNKQPS